jgi:PrcB C-terminal
MTCLKTLHSWRHLFLSVLILSLALVILFSAGCANQENGPTGATPDLPSDSERNIPLITLAQGVSSEYGRFDEMPIPADAPPECMVITDGEEFQRLLSLASLQETPAAVDFTNDIVIAAVQGPKNSGGYAISIMHASQTGREVRVEVEIVVPEPGTMTVQVLTSPYHFVTAKRSDFDPNGEVTFTFLDQQDNLIERQGTDL